MNQPASALSSWLLSAWGGMRGALPGAARASEASPPSAFKASSNDAMLALPRAKWRPPALRALLHCSTCAGEYQCWPCASMHGRKHASKQALPGGHTPAQGDIRSQKWRHNSSGVSALLLVHARRPLRT
jgi:hypothetical protein